MLVYGDRAAVQDTAAKLGRIHAGLTAAGQGAGVVRHAALVSILIEAGELAQGLADADFARAGCDAGSPVQDAAMALCTTLAHQVRASWRGRPAAAPTAPAAALQALQALPLVPTVRTKAAEGFAFYAVYPEAYLEAAERAAMQIRAPVEVIGLRSIGAALAPMVAAGLGARAPVTLRPVGHPFRRALALSPQLAGRLGGPGRSFAVVDEGPGLSGSTFAAVGDHLEQGGVASRDIHLFPGHPGEPGPEAEPGLHARWRAWPRHVVEADCLLIDSGRLQGWASELVGPAVAPLEDISGGAWRARMFAREADWPPVWAGQERRKFLMRTASATWLLKFAGLGHEGGAKLARARTLHEVGFGPQTPGLVHGFLVQRWLDDARPLEPRTCDRRGLIAHLGRYLGFRARHFPAADDLGADLESLWRMARTNIAEALGDAAAAPVDRWRARLPSLARTVIRVETDGRLHPWEWLLTPGGGLVKADALDHCRSHDLIGRQDIAWDVAGAAVEFDLSGEELRRLVAAMARPVAPELLALMTLCYRAFQLGRCAMAEACAPTTEAERLRRARTRYAHGLQAAIAA